MSNWYWTVSFFYTILYLLWENLLLVVSILSMASLMFCHSWSISPMGLCWERKIFVSLFPLWKVVPSTKWSSFTLYLICAFGGFIILRPLQWHLFPIIIITARFKFLPQFCLDNLPSPWLFCFRKQSISSFCESLLSPNVQIELIYPVPLVVSSL